MQHQYYSPWKTPSGHCIRINGRTLSYKTNAWFDKVIIDALAGSSEATIKSLSDKQVNVFSRSFNSDPTDYNGDRSIYVSADGRYVATMTTRRYYTSLKVEDLLLKDIEQLQLSIENTKKYIIEDMAEGIDVIPDIDNVNSMIRQLAELQGAEVNPADLIEYPVANENAVKTLCDYVELDDSLVSPVISHIATMDKVTALDTVKAIVVRRIEAFKVAYDDWFIPSSAEVSAVCGVIFEMYWEAWNDQRSYP